MWVTHKRSRSVRALVVVLYIVVVNHSLTSPLKSFISLKTGHNRIYIATYHDVTILGDRGVWLGVVPSDVRQSGLVNKHIKRGVIISIHSFDSIKFKFKFDSTQKLNSFDSRFIAIPFVLRRCLYDLKYICSWSQTCCANSATI